MSAWPIRLLVLGNLALLAVLGRQWVDGTGELRQPTWTPPAPVQPALASASLQLTEPGDLSPTTAAALVERPLFHPTRRPLPPPPPPQAVAPPPPPDPLDFTVVQGLVAGDTGVVLATVRGTPRRLVVGQKVGEWALTAVAPQAATFTRNGTQRELKLALSTLGVAKPLPLPAASAPAAGGGAAAAPARAGSLAEAGREEQREILRRRNELRAQRGLPPLPQ